MIKGILPDFEIKRMGSDLIFPYNADQINPVSYDIQLGGSYILDINDEIKYFKDIEDQVYLLQPGEFLLSVTKETFTIPDDMVAQFYLKSTMARMGLEHAMAGWIDAGYKGKLTLELKNNSNWHAIELRPGQRIGQVIFTRLEKPVGKSYGVDGHYQGDMEVRGPWKNL